MHAPQGHPAPLRLCLVDMNNGVPNQAIRCFHVLVERFFGLVRRHNPDLCASVAHVQPRNLGEVPPADCDLYLCTGGPGSPFDGYDQPWCTGFRRLLDGLVEEDLHRDCAGDAMGRGALLLCHSFELAVLHFGVAQMVPRPTRKFGVMPVYPTEEGQRSPLLARFGDRLFVWEHRNWQAVALDEPRLHALGGELWARESRDGRSKGEGLMAFRFAPLIEGVQFHPEADRHGALSWLLRPEQAAAAHAAYGEEMYRRMLRTLDDPERLARTFALLIPGWLVRRFNALAPARGWRPLPPPVYDAEAARQAFFGPET